MSDLHFPKVELLLHFEGADLSTAFPDSSSRARTVTPSGNAHIGTGQGLFGTSGGVLDGAGDYLTVGAAGDFTWLHTGATDYALEIGFRLDSVVECVLADSGGIASGTRGIGALVTAAGALDITVARGTGGTYAARYTSAASTISSGTYHRLLLAMLSGTLYVLLDGTLRASMALSSPSASAHTSALTFGRYVAGNLFFLPGNYDEIRITKDESRHTADYTLDTAPFPDSGPINPPGLRSAATMGAVVLGAHYTVQPPGLRSPAAMGASALRRHPDSLDPPSVPSQRAMAPGVIGGHYTVVPPGLRATGRVAPSQTAFTVKFPLRITVPDHAVDLHFPIRVQVVPPQDIRVPLRVTVLDPAALGGLDGAGGWAPAPSGRWQAVVVLDGADISDRLVGVVKVRCAVNAARLADFAFLPSAPLAPMGLVGRPVRIAFAERGPSGARLNVQTMFSGVVDQPSVDAASGEVSCACTDQLQEIISNTARDWLDIEIGGRWHVAVSGEPSDTWQYALDRLASVPKSIALDALQRPRVLTWRDLPKAVTLREADLDEGSLRVDLPRRSQIRTRILARPQYRRANLRNRGVLVAWSRPVEWFVYGNGFGPRNWLTTAMVEQAAKHVSGFELVGDLAIEHPEPGSYLLGLVPEDGFYIITPEVAPDLVIGFSGRYAARWSQTATEDYAYELVATNLEALLGQSVPEEMGFSMEAPPPDENWEQDTAVRPRYGWPDVSPPEMVYDLPALLVGDTVVSAAETPVAVEGYSRDEFDAATLTLLDQAWVRLDDAARSGRVIWSMPCRPDLWLDTWCQVETDHLRAAGGPVEVVHVLDAASGDASTEVVIAVGMPGDTPAAMPTWTLADVPEAPGEGASGPAPADLSCTCADYVGNEPDVPEFDPDTMIGFVTNCQLNNPGAVGAVNVYPYHLTIKSPDVAAADRDPAELPVPVTVPVTIPTDLLEIL